MDELALRLLSRLNRNDPNRPFSRDDLTEDNQLLNQLEIDTNDLEVRRSIAQAYDWLMAHALIAREVSHTRRQGYITKRGHRALMDANALGAIRAFKRIDLDLHPLISRRIRRQFNLGEFESAVLLAFKEVEIRVRDLGKFPASLIGTKLMHDAFKSTGSLTDRNLDAGEQVAIMNLFAGAIGAFKNPSSHRQVDYGDATVASEAVLLADLLLRILDQYEGRLLSESNG